VNSTIRILHLSDTHVSGTATSEERQPSLALDRLLASLEHIEELDLVLVSGDIADDGSAEGSIMVRDRIARFASLRGIPHIYLPGNHDTRAGFRSAFGSGHLSESGQDLASSSFDGEECAAVSHHNGLRVVTLDSVVPGETYGWLGEDQVAWLRRVLDSPAPQGTIVALHHPPIPVADSPFLSGVNLRDPGALAAAIEGSDVRGVLCGHFHLQAMGFLGTVPVWVCPGAESRVDVTAPRDTVRFVADSGASIISLPSGAGAAFHVVQVSDASVEAQIAMDVDLRTLRST
jgi:3',5'-cyclic AMP phosphodiesterase CpdA